MPMMGLIETTALVFMGKLFSFVIVPRAFHKELGSHLEAAHVCLKKQSRVLGSLG